MKRNGIQFACQVKWDAPFLVHFVIPVPRNYWKTWAPLKLYHSIKLLVDQPESIMLCLWVKGNLFIIGRMCRGLFVFWRIPWESGWVNLKLLYQHRVLHRWYQKLLLSLESSLLFLYTPQMIWQDPKLWQSTILTG